MTINAETLVEIRRLLGREPRGLQAVAVADDGGAPMVLRVASLVDNKPFPNLFWLVDADLVYRIDTEEATGLIKRMQLRVDADPELQAAMGGDHQAYIELRNSYISTELKAELQGLGYWEVLQQRGIGGIADRGRIRCLHTWYAAHLVVPNTIGRLLDAHWAGVDSERVTAKLES